MDTQFPDNVQFRSGRTHVPPVFELFSHLEKVQAMFSSIVAEKTIEDVAFSPLLGDVDQLNIWTEEGHPWTIGSLTVLDRQIPFPEWIANRQKEIESALVRGMYPNSRLSNREDLIGEV